MSICPTPRAATTTDYSNPGSYTNTPPQPKFEMCVGGTTSTISGPNQPVTTTQCCPNPGPQGPAGCALKWESEWVVSKPYNYESGSPCVTSMVVHNGVTYIAKVAYIADADTEPGVGAHWTDKWDIFMQDAGHLVWKGTWADATDYKKNDVILSTTNGTGYVCVDNHTSAAGDPDLGDPGAFQGESFYWEKMQDVSMSSFPTEEKGFLEGLMDGVMDWWKDADLLTKVLALAAGAGLIYAGSKLLDMMEATGEGDGEASSTYDGSPGYNGAFTPPTLPTVVTSVMGFAGYDPSQLDVSLLPNTPVHFTITGGLNVRALMTNLALTYQFDVVPSAGTVKFVPKYQEPIRSLTTDDLGHGPSDGDKSSAAPYTAKRHQGLDLPRSIQFTYYSNSLDHNTFTQIASIPTYEEGQDVQISVPFSLDDSEAMRIAETTLVNAHIEQQEYVFTTDYHNIDLEPGDVIEIPVNNVLTQVRIKEINETQDGVLEFKTSRSDYNTQSYSYSGVSVSAPPAQTTNVPTSLGYSDTLFIEVPPINSNDTTPRLLGITHGYNRAGWPGAAIYRSTDGGNTYSAVASNNKAATFGIVATTTPAPSKGYWVWDDTTTISVTLKQGTLSTLSDLAVLNGANWALVGEELIGFATATLTAPNTYTLSRLLRGRRGSEPKCDTHVNNELFVLIDDSLTRLEYANNAINAIAKYKTVTIGSSLDKATAVDVQPIALNMRPWKPGHCKVVKNGQDFVFTWTERPRYNNGLQDRTELTHDTDWAGYGISIFTDSTAAEIKRTAVVVVNTYTYTAAMQIADFGSVQSTIKGSVVQMSSVVGGGYPAVVSV